MSAIGPGDFVECVDDAPDEGRAPLVVKGAIYEVSGVFDGPYGPYLTLAGMDPSPYPGWFLHRFRPVYRPKQELIQSLLTGSHDRVPA